MMTQAATRQTPAKSQPISTVAIITNHPQRDVPRAAFTVMDNALLVVEPTSRAYSQIKRMGPDLIVVFLSNDAVDACQVLSMLALDRETSRIPVVTWAAEPSDDAACEGDELASGAFTQAAQISLN
jgi:hypothetical protein